MDDATRELFDAVRTRAEDTGYEVTETDDGFRVERNLADARWWGPLYAAGVKRLLAHEVRVDAPARRIAIADELRSVGWKTGASPQPFWSGGIEMQRGRILGGGFRTSYGVRRDGTFGAIEDYRYRTDEGRDLIRGVAKQLGWRETWPVEAKIGAAFAAVAVVGAVVTAVVLVVAAALGKF